LSWQLGVPLLQMVQLGIEIVQSLFERRHQLVAFAKLFSYLLLLLVAGLSSVTIETICHIHHDCDECYRGTPQSTSSESVEEHLVGCCGRDTYQHTIVNLT
jgi:hypothetical protein